LCLVGLASFLPIFFFDQYGVTRVQAGNFAALCVFAGSLLRPCGGFLADRFGGIRVLSILYALVALLLLELFMLPSLSIAVSTLLLIMTSLGTGNGAVFQLVPQRFGKEIGVATGIVGAAGGLGGFLLPAIMGAFKDLEGSYAPGLLLFALVAACAVLALSRIKHTWRTQWARTEFGVAL
jgi:NNP family nitrate/nitrite transporter-like MFS transporter